MRANRLHEIAGEAIPCAGVAMENSDTGIEAEFGNRESRFGFQDRIEIVEH